MDMERIHYNSYGTQRQAVTCDMKLESGNRWITQKCWFHGKNNTSAGREIFCEAESFEGEIIVVIINYCNKDDIPHKCVTCSSDDGHEIVSL